jgi:hypothetical protein
MKTLEFRSLYRAVVAVGRYCLYCGARATEADHVLPAYLGGMCVAENLVPACKKCNCTKNKKRLLPEIEKKAREYACIQAPLVREVADSILCATTKAKPIGLEFVA